MALGPPSTVTTPPAPPRWPASEQSKDDPPNDAARAKLRRQAREWLQAELAAWSRILDSGTPEMKAKITPTLHHWNADPDIAGIRDEKALAKLPEAERENSTEDTHPHRFRPIADILASARSVPICEVGIPVKHV
jgi:hypothetical protein